MRATRLTRLLLPATCALAMLAGPALAQMAPSTPPSATTSGTQADTPATPPAAMSPASPPPASAAPSTAPAPAATPATTATAAPTSIVKLTRADKFTTAAAAAASCPGDTVVWSTLNKKSHNFHLSGSRYYGTTKHGSYVCEKAALAAGFHQAKG